MPKDNLIYLNLEQASRAVVCCFLADVPVAVWGDPGAGKSAVMAQIAERIDYKLYDVRSSILEPSDFGIPYPDGNTVKWLMTEMLPYEELVGDQKCILLFDEFDRTSQEVLNAELQVIHDRQLNGHKLSKNCRIAACGNGASDIGTTPLSRAAMNRMCHIYVDTASRGANKAWQDWAESSGNVSPEMISYCNFAPQNKGEAQYEDYAHRTRRSIVAADRIYQASKDLDFKLDDIMQALVAGCIGKDEAIKFLNHCKTVAQSPTLAEIIEEPGKVRVPKDASVLHALSELLVNDAKFDGNAEKSVFRGERYLQYAMRWPEEPQTNLVKKLLQVSPKLKNSQHYKMWEAKRAIGKSGPKDTPSDRCTCRVIRPGTIETCDYCSEENFIASLASRTTSYAKIRNPLDEAKALASLTRKPTADHWIMNESEDHKW